MQDQADSPLASELSASDPPDWSLIKTHPLCPLCGYSLYGLATARCPECGYPFDWQDVLDERLEQHPYLFEYHPESNVKSYVQTTWSGCFPRTFWKTLHPRQKPRLARLITYWLVGCFVFLFMLGIDLPIAAAAYWQTGAARWGGTLSNSLLDAVLSYGWGSRWWLRDMLMWGTPVILGPWVCLAVLSVFRLSMRRARIQTAQVVRTVVYACDPFIAGQLTLLSIFVSVMAFYDPYAVSADMLEILQVFFPAVACLLIFYRLWMAYKHYLRFDHPFLTVLATAIIVFLAWLNVYLVLVLR